MTNRIEELAKQAGFKHPDHVGLCEEYAYFDHKNFAELIVRQCVFELMYESTKQSNVVIQDFSVTVANSIKQHFGVEE